MKMESFADKRKALFDCLDDASKELKGTSLDQTDVPNDSTKLLGSNRREELNLTYRNYTIILSHKEKDLHHLRGKESIFKKPSLPITRCLKPRKTPDYEINPHRWTRYSLEDLDISENSNTSAAMAFLNQMGRIKESVTDDEPKEDCNEMDTSEAKMIAKKIEFKKLCQLKRNLKSFETVVELDPQLDKAKFKGAKLIMPEYTIGQAPRNLKLKSKVLKNQERAAGSLKLSHLMEQEDEEEK